MYQGNVSSDWNCYYLTCPTCGRRFHASEGYCCPEETETRTKLVRVRSGGHRAFLRLSR